MSFVRPIFCYWWSWWCALSSDCCFLRQLHCAQLDLPHSRRRKLYSELVMDTSSDSPEKVNVLITEIVCCCELNSEQHEKCKQKWKTMKKPRILTVHVGQSTFGFRSCSPRVPILSARVPISWTERTRIRYVEGAASEEKVLGAGARAVSPTHCWLLSRSFAA